MSARKKPSGSARGSGRSSTASGKKSTGRGGPKLRYVPTHPEKPDQREIVTLPRVAMDPEMWKLEEPVRLLIREAKKVDSLAPLAAEVSQGAGYSIQTVEPVYSTGKKVLRGAGLGHQSTHGTPEQKRERWDEMQRQVTSALAENHRLSHLGACGQVARSAKEKGLKGWTQKTVSRHTTDPRKATKK